MLRAPTSLSLTSQRIISNPVVPVHGMKWTPEVILSISRETSRVMGLARHASQKRCSSLIGLT